jgi:colicin import membrane protein
LLFGLALAGLWWTRASAPVSAAGPVIEAELIDPDALSVSMRRVLRERPQPVAAEPEPLPEPLPEPADEDLAPAFQPLPEPVPDEAPEPPQPQAQQPVPEPDTREQARVTRDAAAQPAREQREQEERRRQEQLDLTERQRQQDPERKQRLSQMQSERQQQLDDIRRKRAAAARDAQLAEQKLQQLAERSPRPATASAASPPPGNNGADADLKARYAAALQAAILRNWTRPESVPLGQRCRLIIRQIVGGEVVDVQTDPSCPYDEQGRRSIEAAVLKAQPLPYAGFETVFNRTLTLNFEARDR